jgi:radical SAM protein with 4Fe4S-binding SPASM domain
MKKKYFQGLMIEPTNICNLQCPVCMTGQGLNKLPKGYMKFYQFKSIIDQSKNFLKQILLWGYGEPFIAPEIMKMIDYAGKRNTLMTIHTNGNILNKKMMNRFRKNYRMNIRFSIDGITQKSYSYYRKNGNLKKALNNLSYLLNLKKKHNLFNLRIEWQFLITKANEIEVADAQKLAREMGVDAFILKTLGIAKTHPRYADLIPVNKNLTREGDGVNRQANQNCFFINPGHPVIFWQGDIHPCCYDFNYEYKMGNAFRDQILNVWNGKKYQEFRKKNAKGINILCNGPCKWKKRDKMYVNQ